MRCWVVGASGLLGGAVVRSARRARWDVATSRVPWLQPDEAVRALSADARAFFDTVGDEPWAIAWCAGAGVVGTGREALENELHVLRTFLDGLADLLVSSDHVARGSMFLASSAGGVYAGASGPPFTESTEPRPLAPYGEFKLLAEAAVTSFAADSGLPVLVGRISNLFGPGQDLSKPQGLVSQIGRSCLTRQPIRLYVSLDTMRDYLFVDDCADMVVQGLARLGDTGRGTDGLVITKILAAGRSTTIAAVLGEYRRVLKRPPLVTLASSPAGRFQVRDLRMHSTVWTDLDIGKRTSLGAGIAATLRDVTQRLHGAGVRPTP